MTWVLVLWFSINDQYQMESINGFGSLQECNLGAAKVKELLNSREILFGRRVDYRCIQQSPPLNAAKEKVER